MTRQRFPRTLHEAFPASAYRWYFRDPRRRYRNVCRVAVGLAAFGLMAWLAAQGV